MLGIGKIHRVLEIGKIYRVEDKYSSFVFYVEVTDSLEEDVYAVKMLHKKNDQYSALYANIKGRTIKEATYEDYLAEVEI